MKFKKNILAVALLASLSTTAFATNTLQDSVQNMANPVQPTQTFVEQAVPPLPPTDFAGAELPATESELSIEEIIALKMKDPVAEISKLDKEIFESEVQKNLDRYNKAKSFLEEEKVKSLILEEKMRQNRIVRTENEAILKEIERTKSVETKKVEEKKIEEQQIIEKQQEMIPVITDNVIVYSIYSSSGNGKVDTAEMVINGVKYYVKTGDKTNGFSVISMDDHGITLAKNGVEQYVNVSPVATVISTQEQPQQDFGPQPNVIKPYELR